MKKLKTTLIVAIALIFGSFISSCGGSSSSPAEEKSETKEVEVMEESMEEEGIEYTSAFIYPMHCEGSGSETEGVCPVCEMDYVANEN